MAFGSFIRRCYKPLNDVTFNSLNKGFCMEGNIREASQLIKKTAAFGCTPNVTTCDTLITGLRRTGNMSLTLKLHREMVNGMGDFGGIYKPNVFSYGSLIDRLCKDRLVDQTKDLFMEMKDKGINANTLVYT